MPRLGFETTTAAFELANTVYFSDRAAVLMASILIVTEKHAKETPVSMVHCSGIHFYPWLKAV
jgi:hypothetical protein